MTLGTLLVVDDDLAQLTALCDTLGDHGYAATGCNSARDALEVLQRRDFDILLTDLQMPGVDGIALLRAALEIRPDLVGVLMTGHGSIGTAVEAMKIGALDYVLKPFKLSAALPVLARAVEVKRLRQRNADLEHRLRERAAELETANADLEAFSRSVAHDLRGPLQVVSGCAELLRMSFGDSVPPDAAQLIDRIQHRVDRMDALIRGLLNFARLGRQPLDRQPLDMYALALETIAELREQRDDRTTEVLVDPLPGSVGDGMLIRQVLVNLLSNAFKFTHNAERPVIHVGGERGDGETAYFVRDNGVGFDMASAPRLFDVFQRLHDATGFEGTGIGLSIVQRIVQRHGGRVRVDAEVGAGATFYFTLPAAP